VVARAVPDGRIAEASALRRRSQRGCRTSGREIADDDPELASSLRIEERELAGGRN